MGVLVLPEQEVDGETAHAPEKHRRVDLDGQIQTERECEYGHAKWQGEALGEVVIEQHAQSKHSSARYPVVGEVAKENPVRNLRRINN